MNEKLPTELLGIIFNNIAASDPYGLQRISLTQQKGMSFFFEKVSTSNELLDLAEVALLSPDVKKYRCPWERKNWQEVKMQLLAEEKCFEDMAKRRFQGPELMIVMREQTLLNAVRRKNIQQIQLSKVKFLEISNFKDRQGNNLLMLAKLFGRQDIVDFFYSVAEPIIIKSLNKGLDKKLNPIYFRQDFIELCRVINSVFREEAHIKKQIFQDALLLAVTDKKIPLNTVKKLIAAFVVEDRPFLPFNLDNSDLDEKIPSAFVFTNSETIQILEFIIKNDRGDILGLFLEKLQNNGILVDLIKLIRVALSNKREDIIRILVNHPDFDIHLDKENDLLIEAIGNNLFDSMILLISKRAVYNFDVKLLKDGLSIQMQAFLLLMEFLVENSKKNKDETVKKEFVFLKKIYFLNANQNIEAFQVLGNLILENKNLFQLENVWERYHIDLKDISGIQAIVDRVKGRERKSFIYNNLAICLDIIEAHIDVLKNSECFVNPRLSYKEDGFGVNSKAGIYLSLRYQNSDSSWSVAAFFYTYDNYNNFTDFIQNVAADFSVLYLQIQYRIKNMMLAHPERRDTVFSRNMYLGHEGILDQFLQIDLKAGTTTIDWDKYRATVNQINQQSKLVKPANLKSLSNNLKGKEELPFGIALRGYLHLTSFAHQKTSDPEKSSEVARIRL